MQSEVSVLINNTCVSVWAGPCLTDSHSIEVHTSNGCRNIAYDRLSGQLLMPYAIPICLYFFFMFVISTQVNISCQARLPDEFVVNVTGPGLVKSIQIIIPYDHSEEMNLIIPVPGVEDCTGLRVQIKATNSAGTSEFSEIPLPGEYQYFSKEECGL